MQHERPPSDHTAIPDSPVLVDVAMMLRTALAEGRIGQVPTRFRYDTTLPYQVRLTFHHGQFDEADWIFSRELLQDGLRGPKGQGDVQLWPASCPCHGMVLYFSLESPHGSAVLEAPAAQVQSWLELTYGHVPLGAEPDSGPTDAQLAALLAGS